MPNESSPKNRPLVNRLASAAAHPLTAIQKWTLVALLDNANKKNGTKVYPGIANICQRTGYKDRATRQALYDLKDLGFINIDAPPGATNIYYLNFEMIEEQAGRKCRTYEPTPALDANPPGIKCQTPRQEMPATPALDANITGKEQSNGTGNLTGSEKSNRQKGEKPDFVTAREACLGAVGQLRGSS